MPLAAPTTRDWGKISKYVCAESHAPKLEVSQVRWMSYLMPRTRERRPSQVVLAWLLDMSDGTFPPLQLGSRNYGTILKVPRLKLSNDLGDHSKDTLTPLCADPQSSNRNISPQAQVNSKSKSQCESYSARCQEESTSLGLCRPSVP